MKRKKSFPVLICLLFLTGCGQVNESAPVVVSGPQEEGISYTTAEAAYDDILVTERVDCTYTQADEYELAFGLDDYRIDADSVLVREGDIVQKGQLLASLDVQDVQETLSALEHTYNANVLKLEQTRQLKQFDLESADTLYYYTEMTNQDREDLEEQKESIEKQYKYTLQDLEDAVTVSAARLAAAKEQIEKGVIYAPVDGEVTYLKRLLDDSYSDSEETVIRISDASTCCFKTVGTDNMDYFAEGEEYLLDCVETKETFYVTPVNMDDWKAENSMSFALTDESALVELDTRGRITVNIGQRENVLCIPENALHTDQDGYFVYMLEDGVRCTREVSVGLSGSGKTEILSGLREGDQVILSQSIGGEVQE